MSEPETFDPAERARQKQAAREQDERDLASGKVTREELQRRNSLFPEGWARKARIVCPNDWS